MYDIAMLEIVAMSVRDAKLAEAAGANRLELVSAIEVGGLTPSLGAVEGVLDAVEIPVAVMLRPRRSGFLYAEEEVWAMQVDAVTYAGMGVAGLVTGILEEDRQIDLGSMAALVDSAKDTEWVMHRAFDLTPDPLRAIDQLVELGFSRILTTGGAATAEAGQDALRRYVEHAAGQIEIMICGAIRGTNLKELMRVTGASAAHAGPFREVNDATAVGDHPTAMAMGADYLEVDEEEIRALAAALR